MKRGSCYQRAHFQERGKKTFYKPIIHIQCSNGNVREMYLGLRLGAFHLGLSILELPCHYKPRVKVFVSVMHGRAQDSTTDWNNPGKRSECEWMLCCTHQFEVTGLRNVWEVKSIILGDWLIWGKIN